jgi:hypothetical protein
MCWCSAKFGFVVEIVLSKAHENQDTHIAFKTRSHDLACTQREDICYKNHAENLFLYFNLLLYLLHFSKLQAEIKNLYLSLLILSKHVLKLQARIIKQIPNMLFPLFYFQK